MYLYKRPAGAYEPPIEHETPFHDNLNCGHLIEFIILGHLLIHECVWTITFMLLNTQAFERTMKLCAF